MPLYEGLSLITDKHAPVFDFGTAFTKCGFAGETGPRCIIPSVVSCSRTGVNRRLMDYKDATDLYGLLVDFLHYIHFKYLLVNPKERRVVVVESLFCPTVFRETLAKTFFNHFEVTSILYVPLNLVSLCTLGVDTALVLDVGYSEAVLVPVYEGIPVLHAWQAQPVAGKAVSDNLQKLLMEKATVRGSGLLSSIAESNLEDVKVRTCFTTTLARGLKIQEGKCSELNPPFNVTYPLNGDKIVDIPGDIRELAAEVLFECDNDQVSLPTMILDAILKCPVDMRKKLAQNILIIGGCAMMPGFKSRVFQELVHLLDTPKYKNYLSLKELKFHTPPAKENYVAWLGGAIFGATEAIHLRCLPRDQFLKKNCVPDWSDLRYNCHEEKSL